MCTPTLSPPPLKGPGDETRLTDSYDSHACRCTVQGKKPNDSVPFHAVEMVFERKPKHFHVTTVKLPFPFCSIVPIPILHVHSQLAIANHVHYAVWQMAEDV